MDNQNENADSQNGEEIIDSSNNEHGEDTTALEEKNRQLFERAKKAETEVKELKEFKAKVEAEKAQAKPEKSNDLDYGKMAYLKSNGIDQADDVDFIENEAKATGKPLTELLS